MQKIYAKNYAKVVSLFSRSSVGVLSVFSRWNSGRYKRNKRDGYLNKTHIFYFGVLWSFLGSSFVRPWLKASNGQREYREEES